MWELWFKGCGFVVAVVVAYLRLFCEGGSVVGGWQVGESACGCVCSGVHGALRGQGARDWKRKKRLTSAKWLG